MIPQITKALKQWCSGRNGWVRIPFVIGFAYIFVKHITDPRYSSILGGLNLGIHEFGHLVFGLGGQFLGVAGGTMMQLLAPFYGVYNFIKLDDYFSTILCFGWLSTSLYEIAWYAADARAMALPLLSPFGNPHVIHDWNYLLTKTGLLNQDALVASLFRGLGFMTMIFALWVCGWMILQMIKNDQASS